MQNISTAATAALAAYAPVTLHLLFSGAEIPTKIGSFTLTAGVGQDEINVGNAIAANLEMTVDADPVIAYVATLSGARVKTLAGQHLKTKWSWDGIRGMDLTVTWDVGTGTTYPLFSGTIEKGIVSAGKVTITAHDAMFFSGAGGFADQGRYQADVAATTVLAAIASNMGVPLDSATRTMAAGVTISGGFSSCQTTLSCSEAAGYVAGLLGGNAVITRSGTLAVKRYSPVAFTTEPYAGEAMAEDLDYTPTGLSFQRTYTVSTVNEDGTTSETEETKIYSAGDGTILLDNPLGDQAAATRAYNALKSISVRKGQYGFPCGLQLEPGDVITVTSMDGDYPAAVSAHTLDIDGGVRSTVVSGGSPPTGGSSGPISQALEMLKAEFAQFKTLVAENAEIGSAKITNLVAEDIKGGTFSGKVVNFEEMRGDSLTAGTIQSKDGTVSINLDTGAYNLGDNGKVSVGAIDVIDLFAEDIKATGKFEVDNGVWKLEQGTFGMMISTNTGGVPFAQQTSLALGDQYFELSLGATANVWSFYNQDGDPYMWIRSKLQRFTGEQIELSADRIYLGGSLIRSRAGYEDVTLPVIQRGTAEIQYFASDASAVSVTFDVPYASAPQVIVSQVFNTSNIIVLSSDISATGFTARVPAVGSAGTREFSWVAFGSF